MTTTDPDPRADLFDPAVLRRMPDHARKHLEDTLAAIRAGNPVDDPGLRVESPEEQQLRLARAQEHRAVAWRRMLPSRFQDATLDDLAGEPGLRDGRVAGWLRSPSRVLVLRSDRPGNGKTHSLYALGNTAVAAGLWVAAWTMADLNAALRPTGEANDPDAYPTATRCDILGIDDLGREKITDWTVEQLHRVLDDRARNNRRLIITTNLTGDQLVDRYGDPIVDRITDGVTVVEYVGPTRRRKAPW